MINEILYRKSDVQIVNNKWVISMENSEFNQTGSKGRDDVIRRQDAIRLVVAMNIRLANSYEKAKKENPELAVELLETTKVLDYVLWGLREIEPVEEMVEETDSAGDIHQYPAGMKVHITKPNADCIREIAEAAGVKTIDINPSDPSLPGRFTPEELMYDIKGEGKEEFVDKLSMLMSISIIEKDDKHIRIQSAEKDYLVRTEEQLKKMYSLYIGMIGNITVESIPSGE